MGPLIVVGIECAVLGWLTWALLAPSRDDDGGEP